MKMSDLSERLALLNEAQYQAVTSNNRVIRVIAGAGSGKTRVLIERMRFLIQARHFPAERLLALTFTNKAAQEMRSRLQEVLCSGEPWLGTFHGICYRILRQHAEKMGWNRYFVVMDAEDQQSFIKRLMQLNNWDDKHFTHKMMAARINVYKEKGLRAGDIELRHNRDFLVRDFYLEYERQCQAQGRMDFAELLLLTVELFQNHEAVRRMYQQRFLAVLVDEFQDTNYLQMQFLNLILGDESMLFVVGDDDQSIYSWRGARVENILHLDRAFNNVETIVLNDNYRSTQAILDAANALIDKNSARLDKNLRSHQDSGEKPALFGAFSEKEELDYVCQRIHDLKTQGYCYQDMAILYRSNAISRLFEEGLVRLQIPYRIYGGVRFFERAEIKHALAYLRLCVHLQDDSALERIVNVPARGIGASTLANLRELAKQGGVSIWQVITDDDLLTRHFSGRAKNALRSFVAKIHKMQALLQEKQRLLDALALIIKESGLVKMYEESRDSDALSRLDNLEELLNAGAAWEQEFIFDVPLEEKMERFLSEVALYSGERSAGASEDAVQLMTLHAAKGLEFKVVFLVAWEEGIFPSYLAVEEGNVEEERRLAYVGITRAKECLSISYAESRYHQGRSMNAQESRFIEDISEEFLHVLRPRKNYFNEFNLLTEEYSTRNSTVGLFKVGDSVVHGHFGQGMILEISEHSDPRVLVRFVAHGEKWLVLNYANLQKI